MSSLLTQGRVSVRRIENERRGSGNMVVKEGGKEEERREGEKERRKEEKYEKSHSIIIKLN